MTEQESLSLSIAEQQEDRERHERVLVQDAEHEELVQAEMDDEEFQHRYGWLEHP